jgi:hypothetical protein
MNPQTWTEKKEVPENVEYMENLWDGMSESYFWACPKCLTDEYLTDNID